MFTPILLSSEAYPILVLYLPDYALLPVVVRKFIHESKPLNSSEHYSTEYISLSSQAKGYRRQNILCFHFFSNYIDHYKSESIAVRESEHY